MIKSKSKSKKAKKGGGDNRVLLQVQLPRRLRDAFQASCAAEGLTVSSVVRAFMSEVVLRATQNSLNRKEEARDDG